MTIEELTARAAALLPEAGLDIQQTIYRSLDGSEERRTVIRTYGYESILAENDDEALLALSNAVRLRARA